MATHNSFNYGGSPAPPMGYRSYSNESTPAVQRASPQTLNRATSYHMMSPAGNSPASQQSSSPYVYQRQVSGQEPEGYAAHPSPSQRALYPPSQHVSGPYYPQAADMPRSLSYPSYAQPYPSPGAYMSAPMHPPSLARHNTTQALSSDGMSMRQGISYNFGTRLPIIDRPFKCDECVQSFNRNHDLKRHKRIHLAVKPFGCDKCGKTFSRKDALRRHWLVKGCRGEEGATAIITPMFPINARPAHSPPSPTSRRISPEYAYGPAPLNIPPISTESQVIVTPDDVPQGSAPMDEPMVVDSATSLSRGGSSGENGYFDGVVGLKQDGYHSPYASKFASPVQATRHQQHQQHHQGNASPSYEKTYSPSGKPQFAAPFSSQQQGYLQEGMHGAKMEKQGSADGSDPGTWQRW